jgi:hypothetical protein
MTDVYLLATPFLVLGVLALVRFVGCDLVFPLHDVPLVDPPQNVVARPGNASITLTWDPLPDAQSYVVKRSEVSGGPYDVTIAVPVESQTVTDSPLTNGTTYFYVVAGVKGNTEGTPSVEVSATPAQAFVTFKTLGTVRNDFTGVVGMLIQVAGTPLAIVGLGRVLVPGNSGAHVVKVVDAATNADVPGATVTVDTAAPLVTSNDFVYGILPAPIVLAANAGYYVVTHETAGGDQWFNNDTTVVTAAVASVTSAVFSDEVSPFVRDLAPGHSYGPVDILF